MRLNIKNDKLYLKNDYAGCMWIFYTILLLPFIFGIYLLWQEPRDIAPLYFVLPFTILFLIAAPIIIKQAVKMKIVTLEIDRTLGQIQVSKRALFSKEKEMRKIDEIDFIQVECSDNDGEFFNVNIHFKDNSVLPILHGNHRASIFGQIKEINDFLEVRLPKIPIKELRA